MTGMRWAQRWSRQGVKVRRRLGLHGDAVALLDYDRHPIRLSVSSDVEYHTRLHSCQKEPETVAWIEQTFCPGDVFYDIGANVGAYTLVTAAYWHEQVRIVAIEPSAINFVRLVRNLALNPWAHQVIPLPVALGEVTAVCPFHLSSLEPGAALHALGDAVDYKGEAFTPLASSWALTFTLDTLVSQFGLPPPRHLKLDVDGTELAVLRGSQRTLEGVRTMLVELDERHPQAEPVRAFLRERGFCQHSAHPYRYGDRDPQYRGVANVIFCR